MARNLDCACLDVWILGPKRDLIDLPSALVGMFMSSSKLFLFSKESHLNSRIRLLLELYGVTVVKYDAVFTVCAKLTIKAFTFISAGV